MTVEGQAAKILTAYVDLVVERGLPGATLEATARRAGLSKAGVLHHFGSISRLRTALFAELRAQAKRDAAVMTDAPAEAIRYYLTSSLDRESELERLVEACYRIAQTGDESALEVLRRCRAEWLKALHLATNDDMLARTILLLGDGMNHNAVMDHGSEHDLLTNGYVDSLVATLNAGHEPLARG